jgi:hypothetical protein
MVAYSFIEEFVGDKGLHALFSGTKASFIELKPVNMSTFLIGLSHALCTVINRTSFGWTGGSRTFSDNGVALKILILIYYNRV